MIDYRMQLDDEVMLRLSVCPSGGLLVYLQFL